MLGLLLLPSPGYTPALHLFNTSDGWAARGHPLPSALTHDYFYTHFHPQPMKNWLNDPNGPMFFNGVYHLFFQYNPNSKSWGDMHWYHLTSTDLMHWKHQPVALAPDQSYDCGGIFSGSATLFHNASSGATVPVLTYSVACGKSIVNAFPADPTDPLLINWTKPAYNPVIPLPPNVSGGFRDPTTAWQGSDGVWRLIVGCGAGEGTCQFKSTDFIKWTYVGAFHSHGGGMWECPDFYRLPGTDAWVLKASAGGDDWWTVGKYTEVVDATKADVFTPLSGNDIRDGNQQYDFGTFYASKVFLDTPNKRAVLFGWVNYGCPGTDWTGIQTFPRVVRLDPANNTKITSYPLPEIASLYAGPPIKSTISLKAGETKTICHGNQLDIQLSAKLASGGLEGISIKVRTLGSSNGTSGKDVAMTSNGQNGTLDGNVYAIAAGEKSADLRLLVDHSVVEAYAQGGRAVATHPFCPASAADTAATVTNMGTAEVVLDVSIATIATANVLPNTTLALGM